MNNMRLSFSRLCHSLIPRCAAVTLVALAWSSLAFCGEIHDAVKRGDLEKVKALLKDNPNLVFSKDDSHGATPLHIAAFIGRTDVAELLLANKADVNAKDINGLTPLHVAAGYGHKDVANLFLANKANVNAKSNSGQTPLHMAAGGGYVDVVQLLLASESNVDAKDDNGFTPLLFAAQNGHKEVVQLLLDNKADVNAKNNSGGTPLRYAEGYGHNDIAQLLRRHGGTDTTTAATTSTYAPTATTSANPAASNPLKKGIIAIVATCAPGNSDAERKYTTAVADEVRTELDEDKTITLLPSSISDNLVAGSAVPGFVSSVRELKKAASRLPAECNVLIVVGPFPNLNVNNFFPIAILHPNDLTGQSLSGEGNLNIAPKELVTGSSLRHFIDIFLKGE